MSVPFSLLCVLISRPLSAKCPWLSTQETIPIVSADEKKQTVWILVPWLIYMIPFYPQVPISHTSIFHSAAAKSHQSCPTLCDPIDVSLPGSSVPGILQARILEWVAISFSNARKWKVKVKSLSRVQLFVTAWTVAYRAPLSMGFSRQEYWSGLPLPSPIFHSSLV